MGVDVKMRRDYTARGAGVRTTGRGPRPVIRYPSFVVQNPETVAQRHQTTSCGTSMSPRRNASLNASMTVGSKSVPEPLSRISFASNVDIALR